VIPDVTETMDMIERELPGFCWLLRSISKTDTRDTMHGQGEYFANIYGRIPDRGLVTYHAIADTRGAALFEAYCRAIDGENTQKRAG
jgi:hypothetical protein